MKRKSKRADWKTRPAKKTIPAATGLQLFTFQLKVAARDIARSFAPEAPAVKQIREAFSGIAGGLAGAIGALAASHLPKKSNEK